MNLAHVAISAIPVAISVILVIALSFVWVEIFPPPLANAVSFIFGLILGLISIPISIFIYDKIS